MSTALAIGHTMARLGGYRFSPAALFQGGTVAGAWYDPSDLSTLFDSSTGTTPVSMPGQGSAVSVGLMLDKSQGLVLGSELVTNGDFSGGTTGWTAVNSTFSVSNGEGLITSTGSFGGIRQLIPAASGVFVLLEVDIRLGTATQARLIAEGALGGTTGTTVTSDGKLTVIAVSSGTTNVRVDVGASAVGTTIYVDNISVRELPGNHAIAFNNTTARPELRARVNLLTYSEEFGNAAWTKIASNEVLSPDANAPGVMFAINSANDSLSSSNRYIGQTVAILQNTQYQFSFYAKPGANTTIRVFTRNDDATRGADFSLVGAGSVTGTYGSGVGAITNIGFGIYLCTVTWTSGTDTSILLNVTCAPNTFGDGSTMFYLSAPDFRPANIGANVPAYQRIADANTYDTNGFPLYLRFDGIDDSMYTPANLNLSGTDKVAVFAGVRKLSDAATGIVTETTDTSNYSIPSFNIWAPNGNGLNNYGSGLLANEPISGAIDFSVGRATTFTAPITNVVTSIFDWAGSTNADKIKANVNGISQTLDFTNSAGTMVATAFGSSILRIGSRMNTGSWLNGQLYSLIIAGSAVSAGNISATEQWVAGKTGIQI